MSVKFEIYNSPVQGDVSEGKKCHARVVCGRTVDTEELAQEICHNASLTEGDVSAAVIELTNLIGTHLAEGNGVHIDGLGYFQLTLKTPDNCNPRTRAEHISVKSVSFRPDKKFRKRLDQIKLVRSEVKIHSSVCSAEVIDEKLRECFKSQRFITCKEFQQMFGFTPSTANRKLKELLEMGKLKNDGTRYTPYYIGGEKLYQK